ncbi:MAG: FecR family protein [Bacteroidia bacterium]
MHSDYIIMDKESAELIAKHLSGNTSAEEEKKLDDWIKKDSFNDELFVQVKKLWNVSENIAGEIDPDIEKAWQKFKYKAESVDDKIKTKLSRWLKIAGLAVLLIAGTYFIKLFFFNKAADFIKDPDGTVKSGNMKMIHVHTTDSVKTFTLPDSSKIVLNKNSTFSYPQKFNGKERTTFLTGEAFFEVKKDTSHPFIVSSLNAKTEVTGTSFDIKAYEKDKDVELDVLSGEVKFSSSEKPREKITLHKGEKGILNNENEALLKEKSSADESWWNKTNARKKIKSLFEKIKY